MNRKTNIFYNIEEDTRFITFDNYTEALTGDILVTDYKIWPSRFICLYIKELDVENLTLPNGSPDNLESRQNIYKQNKEKLIHLLEQYYENKLAVLRDNIDDEEILKDIKPLNYLIDTLYAFVYMINNSLTDMNFDIEDLLLQDTNNIRSLIDFNYISDIIEQQYNGTYADTICTINPNNWYIPVINYNTDINLTDEMTELTGSLNHLYGWNVANESKISPIVNIKQIYDYTVNESGVDKYFYYIKSYIKNIELQQNTSDSTELKFNLLIPLFNGINVVNPYDIKSDDNIEDIEDNKLNLNNQFNVPLGMYFTDNVIKLNIDQKYSTNWSVLISTQFSAFPYSFDVNKTWDNTNRQLDKQAFITYAEILANQNIAYNSFNKYDSIIKSLQSRIAILESKVNNISSVQNIDDLAKAIAELKIKHETEVKELNNQINALENLIDEARIKWQVQRKS